MIAKYFFVLLIATAFFSCKKDPVSSNEKYIVSANKIIGLTGVTFDNATAQVSNKMGYRFEAAPQNVSNLLKGEVHLPAVDDSTKLEGGVVYLHIATNNIVDVASYSIEPVSQSVAYAMMLAYYNELSKTPTGITYMGGNYIETNTGGPTSADFILAKLKSGQPAYLMQLTYGINGKGITINVTTERRSDGQYLFSFGGIH
jgi:hypothetical protein